MSIFQILVAPPLLGMSVSHAMRTLRRQERRSHNLFWTIVWGAAGAMVLRPDLSQPVARLVGIGRGSDLILYLALIAGLFYSFYQYRSYRKLEIMFTDLVRHISIETSVRAEHERRDEMARMA